MKTVFVYDGGGELVAEYSTALASTPQVSYLTQDHLGSPRVITNENGVVTSRKDFMAYGEEAASANRVSGSGGNGYDPTGTRKDYTGYEKDSETGLEYAQARHYRMPDPNFPAWDGPKFINIHRMKSNNIVIWGVILIAILTSCVSRAPAQKTINNWRGLSPLHSTRDDVEKLLGPMTDIENRIYETEKKVVSVRYSAGPCVPDGGDRWNVPADTVTQILVSPKSNVVISSILGDTRGQFSRWPDPEIPSVRIYANVDWSVQYDTTVNSDGTEYVRFVLFRPNESDSKLRCFSKSSASSRH